MYSKISFFILAVCKDFIHYFGRKEMGPAKTPTRMVRKQLPFNDMKKA